MNSAESGKSPTLRVRSSRERAFTNPLRKPKKLGISEITVGGFKSIVPAQSIEVRPLTLLAGANSSGKSSFMQPLLMLKQTMEAPFDSGPLMLDGPNVKFTSGEQLLSRVPSQLPYGNLVIGIGCADGTGVTLAFDWNAEQSFAINHMTVKQTNPVRVATLRLGMTSEEVEATPLSFIQRTSEMLRQLPQAPNFTEAQRALLQELSLGVARARCFLGIAFAKLGTAVSATDGMDVAGPVPKEVQRIIHVGASRGNPERAYPVAAVEKLFPGRFENYVASVIFQWQATNNDTKLADVNAQLQDLGLTCVVKAHRVTETRVDLRVGRLNRRSPNGSEDLVSIADVGFGVSQVLPVIVAMAVAEPGQVVFIEQPELHLHPRAQVKLANVLAEAARRGVRVIAETHSSLLIRGIQTLVAKNELDANLVKLHWFKRSDQDGATTITSADLDENGAFGDWPTDFDEVELRSEGDYLDAVGFASRRK